MEATRKIDHRKSRKRSAWVMLGEWIPKRRQLIKEGTLIFRCEEIGIPACEGTEGEPLKGDDTKTRKKKKQSRRIADNDLTGRHCSQEGGDSCDPKTGVVKMSDRRKETTRKRPQDFFFEATKIEAEHSREKDWLHFSEG